MSKIGQRFHRLLVIENVKKENDPSTYYLCRCDCGVEKIINTSNLTFGRIGVKSCGCYKKDHQGESTRTHGMRDTRIYRIWANMINRVTNPNFRQKEDYAGRGITVCDRWRKFENFLEDMGPSYQDTLTIDRCNNDGNYEPGNCKWSTMAEQNSNKRRAK